MKKYLLPVLVLTISVTLMGQSTIKRFQTGPVISTGAIFSGKATDNTGWVNIGNPENLQQHFQPSFGIGWRVAYNPGWAGGRIELNLGASYNWWNKREVQRHLTAEVSNSYSRNEYQIQLQTIQLPLTMRYYWNDLGSTTRWYSGIGWQMDWIVKRNSTNISSFLTGANELMLRSHEWTFVPNKDSDVTRRWESNAVLTTGFVRGRVSMGAVLQLTTSKAITHNWYSAYFDDPFIAYPHVLHQVPLFNRSPWRFNVEMGYAF